MSENLFPSGHWTGFYSYAPEDKHGMDMHLTFARGKVAGEGNDDFGVFFVRGGYNTTTKECYWTKTYPGSHDVYYRGFREGKGIWGKWEIDQLTTGGFHIWPRSEGSGDLEAQTTAESKPVDAIGVEEVTPAGELSAKHAAGFSAGTWDFFHVSAAIRQRAAAFATCDKLQADLARAMNVQTIKLFARS